MVTTGERAGLRITVIDTHDDEVDRFVELILTASNSSSVASQQFYIGPDGFKDFANQLKGFPATINSRIKLEVGGEQKPAATYLLLEVFCFEPTGRSAIKVKMRTHDTEPYYEKAEFFILCYPASLNRLGDRLFNWDPLEGNVFEWEVE